MRLRWTGDIHSVGAAAAGAVSFDIWASKKPTSKSQIAKIANRKTASYLERRDMRAAARYAAATSLKTAGPAGSNAPAVW